MKKACVGYLFQLLRGGFTAAVSILLSMIVFALIFKSGVTLGVSVDWANRIGWISALAFHTVQPILFYAPILWFRRSRQKLDIDCEIGDEPPKLAEFLIGLFTKRRYRSGLLFSLNEDFQNDLADGMSLSRAKYRYWAATLHSIGPQLGAAMKRIGVIGIVADYVRGRLGGA